MLFIRAGLLVFRTGLYRLVIIPVPIKIKTKSEHFAIKKALSFKLSLKTIYNIN